MDFRTLAAAAALTLALTACGKKDDEAPDAGAAAAEAAPVAKVETTADAATTPPAPVLPAGPDAPAFAVLYPGAQPAPPVEGEEPRADQAVFVAAATPTDIVGFYRQKAEAAGLSPVMAMSQEAMDAFGALSPSTGESLEVVAEAIDDGQSRVTLRWAPARAG